jgi:hypothetical protein
VQLKDGNLNLGNALVLANGSASITFSTLGVGSHAITAVYAGDDNNAGNVSVQVTQTVALSSTSTSLFMSPTSAAVGRVQTFTAVVTGAAPTGIVEFRDGSTVLATAAVTNGQAIFATSNLLAGSHTFVAAYSGDANNAPSVSATLSFAVASAGGSQGKGGGEDVDTPTLPEWGVLLMAMLLLWAGTLRQRRMH